MTANAIRQASSWPADKANRLVELKAAGKSFREIGLELGVSRCAVGGKCKRLRLTAATVAPAIQVARHTAGIALRDARLAAAKLSPPPRPRLRQDFTKSELRAMLYEAVVNTANLTIAIRAAA